jgi:hypothetical protein
VTAQYVYQGYWSNGQFVSQSAQEVQASAPYSSSVSIALPIFYGVASLQPVVTGQQGTGQYTLTYSVSPANSGIIQASPLQATYAQNTEVSLFAAPHGEAKFNHWIIYYPNHVTYTISHDNPTKITITDGDWSAVAYFDAPVQPTQTAAPVDVQLSVDDATPALGQTVYFSVKTFPAVTTGNSYLTGYFDGVSQEWGLPLLSNGVTLFILVPSDILVHRAATSITWKATVNGVESNSVETALTSTSTIPEPTPVGQTPTPTLPPSQSHQGAPDISKDFFGWLIWHLTHLFG